MLTNVGRLDRIPNYCDQKVRIVSPAIERARAQTSKGVTSAVCAHVKRIGRATNPALGSVTLNVRDSDLAVGGRRAFAHALSAARALTDAGPPPAATSAVRNPAAVVRCGEAAAVNAIASGSQH